MKIKTLTFKAARPEIPADAPYPGEWAAFRITAKRFGMTVDRIETPYEHVANNPEETFIISFPAERDVNVLDIDGYEQDLVYIVYADGKYVGRTGASPEKEWKSIGHFMIDLVELVPGISVGGVAGGVIGYFLKPLDPITSTLIGAGLGAGAAGGIICLLTAMGVIPVPTLGAALEGPVAPMRLGKYLVTG